MNEKDCAFCNLPDERLDYQDEFVSVFRDGFPLTLGHTLVVPRRHTQYIFDVDDKMHAEVWRRVAIVRASLAAECGVTDFSIAVNDGPLAGQTIPHAHVHVIPRYEADPANRRGGIRWLFPDRADYWSTTPSQGSGA